MAAKTGAQMGLMGGLAADPFSPCIKHIIHSSEIVTHSQANISDHHSDGISAAVFGYASPSIIGSYKNTVYVACAVLLPQISGVNPDHVHPLLFIGKGRHPKVCQIVLLSK